MSEIAKYSEHTFESIKHVNEYGEEYWLARELQPILEYAQWRRFSEAIDRAKLACENSGFIVDEHFADVGKSSPMPNGGERILDDVMLSRYACYLIVMNGDPRKEVIAVGQTYFAVKTRQQELINNYEQLSEDQKRLAIRNEMIAHNKSLAEAAQMAGIADQREYAIFQNKGYQGLYGRTRCQGDPCPKGTEKEPEDSGSYGQHRVGGPTSSVRPRRTKSFAVRIFRVSRPLMRPIMRLERRSAKLSKNWAAPCRKICPRLKRALPRSSGNRKSGS